MKSIFRILFLLTLTFLGLSAQNKTVKLKLTSEPFLLPPFPSVPAKLPEDSVTMGDWNLTLADGKGKWYATQWALRMMDVVEHYDLDFIYTDGTVLGPFTGNAMQTVMADYYLSDENAVHYIHCVQNRLRGSTT